MLNQADSLVAWRGAGGGVELFLNCHTMKPAINYSSSDRKCCWCQARRNDLKTLNCQPPFSVNYKHKKSVAGSDQMPIYCSSMFPRLGNQLLLESPQKQGISKYSSLFVLQLTGIQFIDALTLADSPGSHWRHQLPYCLQQMEEKPGWEDFPSPMWHFLSFYATVRETAGFNACQGSQTSPGQQFWKPSGLAASLSAAANRGRCSWGTDSRR